LRDADKLDMRHYLEMIRQVLPESEKIEKVFVVAQSYLDKKIITPDEIR